MVARIWILPQKNHTVSPLQRLVSECHLQK